ncbi:GNAT family N-acetyltransferase [Salinimicrobium sediminilitoris]|uniref:GNAT family N-acetyltransferase n=1 Tax=Salinimicrobium sediminilitoris TaxID=2876715 RepID=UPI001E4E3B66|nr:GNAT family N-acetyltransferase [Salinimicrobium sediminilitoris]MCC8358752.1 GNAT family N-acetyltransferase [Salinimicrobium sediminilitoris]
MNRFKTKKEFINGLADLEAPKGFSWDLIGEKYAPDIVRWRNDPEILSFMEMDNKLKLEEQLRFLENYDSFDRVDLILSAKKPVGVFNIKNFESHPEYGAIMGEADYRGKGLGSQVKLLIFKYWFITLNKEEIFVKNKLSNNKVIKSNEGWGFEKYREEGNYIMLRLKKQDFLDKKLQS